MRVAGAGIEVERLGCRLRREVAAVHVAVAAVRGRAGGEAADEEREQDEAGEETGTDECSPPVAPMSGECEIA